MRPPVRRRRRARVEAGEVLGGVGGVVEVELGMDLGDHAPHRLAQQRGGGHRGEAQAERVVGRPRRNRPRAAGGLQVRGKLVVGGEAAEIEERGVEAGVFPVDQPEALAVVDEVGGQQVVVAEDDVDRAERRLEALRRRRAGPAARGHAAAAVGERVGVVADDLEHPEDRRRGRAVSGDARGGSAADSGDALEVARVADVGGVKVRPSMKSRTSAPGSAVDDRRRDAGGVGGAAGRELDARAGCCARGCRRRCARGSAGRVGDDEVEVGDAAGERLRVDRPGPDRQSRRRWRAAFRSSSHSHPALAACSPRRAPRRRASAGRR